MAGKIRKKVYAIKVNAGTDRNGNPRRGWLLYDAKGMYLGFVNEDYGGQKALRMVAPNHIELAVIPTTPAAYRQLLKDDIGVY